MRRIVIWIASTITIVVLLFGYHTSTNQATATGNTRVPNTAPSAGAGSGSSGGSPPNGPSSNSGGSSNGSGSKGSPATKTYTGAVAQTEWGPVQVEITVKNGKVSAVTLPQYPNGNPQDAQINSYAVPILVQETISAQSARIDMVSGATITSGGYIQSLQSALDQAGI